MIYHDLKMARKLCINLCQSDAWAFSMPKLYELQNAFQNKKKEHFGEKTKIVFLSACFDGNKIWCLPTFSGPVLLV